MPADVQVLNGTLLEETDFSDNFMNVLLTGGAGYIGSHTCVELLNAGYHVVVFDNLSNSNYEALHRVERITGKTLHFVHADLRDEAALINAIHQYKCQAVIHFASLKSAGESVVYPLDYFDNNVVGTLCLLRAMRIEGVNKLIFSSSATVYGEPLCLPLTEAHPLTAINPYGRTKLMIEDILRDLFYAEPDWKIGILRYFNPVGAHESGLIGENPQGPPNNLMPYISQVAIGQLAKLNIWGNDYPTPDGTGVRDYIHVVDLAQGHLKALERLDEPECFAVNLGTGKGYSVLEIIETFAQVNNCNIPYKIMPRRQGDVASCYADPAYARILLGWNAQRDLNSMCSSAWLWQSKNPKGYL